jgi:WD40 repeat protein
LDSESGKEKLQIEVPGSEVWALAYSPDGKTLAATTGWDKGQIRLYDAATGKQTQLINCAPLRTSAFAFAPDGQRIATGMTDTSVLVWDLQPKPPQQFAPRP